MRRRLLFLGTGASLGIPVIGCSCAVCQSSNPCNCRLRSSALIDIDQKRFLIDVGPDFRQQALLHQIHALDGLILTHAHHDHIAGLDDVRALYYKRQIPLPILLSKETSDSIQKHFDYLFTPNPYLTSSHPRLSLHPLPTDRGYIQFEGVDIAYVSYEQAKMKVNGFRFGSLAYLTDVKNFDESIFESLKGIKTLIISALRFTASPLHLSVDEAVNFAERLDVDRVWLTHISHELDHDKTNAYLPRHVRLAHDGLIIDFE